MKAKKKQKPLNKKARTTKLASKQVEVEAAANPAPQQPLFGLRWLSPVQEEVGSAIWHSWWSECKRMRVIRSDSKHYPSFFAASFRDPVKGRLETLCDPDSNEPRTFDTLKDALLAARAYHVGILQIEDDDLPDNHLEIVKQAEELGLDVLPVLAPVDTKVVSNVSGTMRKASPDTEDLRGKNRFMLLGFPVTAVLRWMGKAGWSPKEAKEVLKQKKIEVADSTLKSQLHGGLVGRRGEPANLTKGQIEELNSLKPKEQENPSGSVSTRTRPSSERSQEARQGNRGKVVAGKSAGKSQKHSSMGGGKHRSVGGHDRGRDRRGKSDNRSHESRRRSRSS